MSLAFSNLLAFAAVVALPFAGRRRIAPNLSSSLRRYFFFLTLWGAPFVIGQYSQESEWGPIWLQYHFLDFCYGPWGVAFAMAVYGILANMLGREMTERALLVWSFSTILGVGYITEIWDTAWALHYGDPFMLAVDMRDYIALTVGGVVAAMLYEGARRRSLTD